MKPYLQVHQLTKQYGSTAALQEVSLAVARNEIVALLGPNGAGKSTLFGCILGFSQPTKGKILLDGHPLTDADRVSFGYTAERVVLYPQRTVLENAAFFAALKGLPESEAERQVARVGLQEAGTRKVRQLSKGMLQRLGLAIALCGQPELLVLDEPFNGLDPALLGTLQSILRDERKRGATMLISTHTMSAIEPLVTQVTILLRGRLAAAGTMDSLQSEFGPSDSLEDIYRQVALRDQSLEEVLA